MTPSPKLKWHLFHLNGFSQLQPAPGGSAAKSWFLCSVSSFRLFPPFSWLSPGGSPVAICAHYFKHCQAGSSPEVFSSFPLCLPLLDPMQNSVGGPDIVREFLKIHSDHIRQQILMFQKAKPAYSHLFSENNLPGYLFSYVARVCLCVYVRM